MAIMVGHSYLPRKKNYSVYSVPDFLIADKNECETGKHKCDANATCENTEGSYVCTCKPGYFGNGVKCTPSQYLGLLYNICLINSIYLALKLGSVTR